MLLYPPTIEGQLPPAVLGKNQAQQEVITFTIPYQINKGTNPTAITGYSIKIKNLISDKLLLTQDLEGMAADQIVFAIEPDDLNANLGDQFKIQVAFKDLEHTIGYYSTVGVCKLIAKPELKISLNNKNWIGVYINSQPDELLYTSQFVLKNDLDQIIEKSEVETVNYMDSTEDEEFYKGYFDSVVKPGLINEMSESEKELANFIEWYTSNKDIIESIKIISLTKDPTEKSENSELNKFLLFSSYSDLKKNLNITKEKLGNKIYTEKVKDENGQEVDQQIFIPFQKRINVLNGEIDSLNTNGYKCSEEQLNSLKNSISQISEIVKQFKTLFITHKVSLENKNNYWVGQLGPKDNKGNYPQAFPIYYDSVRKSGKVCTYKFNTDLKIGYQYKAEWRIETSSGYKDSIESDLTVANNEVLIPDYTLIPKVRFNEDSGCAELAVNPGTEPDTAAEVNYGRWVITKASSKDNFGSWVELAIIEDFYSWFLSSVNNEFKNILIKDYEIEHGISYKYALQQINDYGVYSVKITTPVVVAKFDDVFLCDEERQLKLAFNPKISSMKDNILESKQDTIGGKYPYIFRNNQVNYKNFSVSGLVSYLQDPDNEFKLDFGDYKEVNTTNLTNENIAKERIFKLEVLNWLNNGKTKLLKSPTEGNYKVRIMNVSMSPNDTLGRMLHNFTATAMEVEDKEFKVKVDLNFMGNKPIHVATIGADGRFDWEDKIIYSLWVYGADSAVSITIGTENHIITPVGKRFEYPEGIKIQSIILNGLITDVYYSLDPQPLGGTFSDAAKCELEERIGTEQGLPAILDSSSGQLVPGAKIEGENFYKVLVAAYENPDGTERFDPNDVNRQIWITDAANRISKYSVVDQLHFEDIQANIVAWGEHIRLTYCYVGPSFIIVAPTSPGNHV